MLLSIASLGRGPTQIPRSRAVRVVPVAALDVEVEVAPGPEGHVGRRYAGRCAVPVPSALWIAHHVAGPNDVHAVPIGDGAFDEHHWFLFFIVIHVTLVFTTGLLRNLNHIYAGRNDSSWIGFGIFAATTAVMIIAWVAATPFTLRHPRVVQRIGYALIGPVQRLFEHVDATPGEYREKDISPYFWHSGRIGLSADAVGARLLRRRPAQTLTRIA